MKFRELRPGERFRFSGRTYLKISPLMARDESDDSQQLIARSAEVTAIGHLPRRAPPERPRPEQVQAALDRLKARLRSGLGSVEPALDNAQATALARTIDDACAEARAALAPPPAAAEADIPAPTIRSTGEKDR